MTLFFFLSFLTKLQQFSMTEIWVEMTNIKSKLTHRHSFQGVNSQPVDVIKQLVRHLHKNKYP